MQIAGKCFTRKDIPPRRLMRLNVPSRKVTAEEVKVEHALHRISFPIVENCLCIFAEYLTKAAHPVQVRNAFPSVIASS